MMDIDKPTSLEGSNSESIGRNLKGGNPAGEMVPNYSEVAAINRVYNSRIAGSGLTEADVARVEALIGQGVSNSYICDAFDEQQKYAAKDSVNQARAIKTALDNLEHNLREAEKAEKEPRPDFK